MFPLGGMPPQTPAVWGSRGDGESVRWPDSEGVSMLHHKHQPTR